MRRNAPAVPRTRHMRAGHSDPWRLGARRDGNTGQRRWAGAGLNLKLISFFLATVKTHQTSINNLSSSYTFFCSVKTSGFSCLLAV